MTDTEFQPAVTACTLNIDCMCIEVHGRPDPQCSHFRKVITHGEVPKEVPHAHTQADAPVAEQKTLRVTS